jgi:hypothetical protein
VWSKWSNLLPLKYNLKLALDLQNFEFCDLSTVSTTPLSLKLIIIYIPIIATSTTCISVCKLIDSLIIRLLCFMLKCTKFLMPDLLRRICVSRNLSIWGESNSNHSANCNFCHDPRTVSEFILHNPLSKLPLALIICFLRSEFKTFPKYSTFG